MRKKIAFNVPEEGDFVFLERTIESNIKIAARTSELIGSSENEGVAWYADTYCTLKELLVEMPDGFSVEGLDPLDPNSGDRMFAVYKALKEKELSFRKRSGQGSQAASKESGGDASTMVQEDVQSNT